MGRRLLLTFRGEEHFSSPPEAMRLGDTLRDKRLIVDVSRVSVSICCHGPSKPHQHNPVGQIEPAQDLGLPVVISMQNMRRNNHPSNEVIGGKLLADAYVVYADGSSLHNPGPAGWAVLIIRPDGSRETLVGSEAQATNNAMELRAAIEALNALPQDASEAIFCDSEYVVKGVNEWRRGWEARGWRNSKGQPVANAGLWRTLFRLADEHPRISLQWVRGHAGEEGNELVDTLARAEAEKVQAGLPPRPPSVSIIGCVGVDQPILAPLSGQQQSVRN